MKLLKSKKSLWLILGGVLLLLIILKFGTLNFSGYKYQAVFLTNNQVYFGKLSKLGSDFPILQDVFYLQLAQPLQPQDPKAAAQPQVNLVKLGGELHGPEDEMQINQNQILFVENLRADSQIVRAIIDFKTKE